jgi:hypothetical protein
MNFRVPCKLRIMLLSLAAIEFTRIIRLYGKSSFVGVKLGL